MIYYTKVNIYYYITQNIILLIVVLVGDSGVGKTSLMSQYIKKEFPESPIPTISVEFSTKVIKIKEGGYVKGQIWDTTGQERYRAIASHHYRKAVGAILVYDVTNRKTFDNCLGWYKDIKNLTEKGCVICLVGNKCDIVKDFPKRREVQKEEGREFAKNNNTLFYEASAKSNNNVVECFEELFQQIYNIRRKIPQVNTLTESVVLKKKMFTKSEEDKDFICC